MGKRGTDVAREAADLVLLDDNFFSVVRAISLGRRIYDNLQKALLYILSIHVPIVGLVLVPAFWSGLPIIMLPVQIVFLELIIDPVCSVAFESQPGEPGVMRRAPRASNAVFFSRRFFKHSVFLGLLLLGFVLLVYWLCLVWGFESRVVRGGAFATLVLGNLFLIASLLSFSQPFFTSVITNRTAVLFLLLAAVLLLFVFSFSFFRDLFLISIPPWLVIGWVVSASVFFLILIEAIKRRGK
jgi:Ca2+-transporting ATPase